METISSILSSMMRVSTPFLFAGLGGLIAQRSGVYNFALEGFMLGGAFFGYVMSMVTGSLFAGAVSVLAFGLLCGLFLAYIVIRFGVSQLVVCLGLNTFFTGLTGYLYRVMDAAKLNISLPELIRPIREYEGVVAEIFAALSKIPIVGPMLFGQNVLVYLAVLLFFAYAWFMKHTETGLSLRAVGENPAAAQTAGINVFKYRYVAVSVSGAFAMMGGAYLTLSQITRFTENMVEGRGWIAIAAIILGKWSPYGTMGGCFMFGLAMAISNQIQTMSAGVPFQVALMVPYVLSMLALLGFGGKKVAAPGALGKPYMKNK